MARLRIALVSVSVGTLLLLFVPLALAEYLLVEDPYVQEVLIERNGTRPVTSMATRADGWTLAMSMQNDHPCCRNGDDYLSTRSRHPAARSGPEIAWVHREAWPA